MLDVRDLADHAHDFQIISQDQFQLANVRLLMLSERNLAGRLPRRWRTRESIEPSHAGSQRRRGCIVLENVAITSAGEDTVFGHMSTLLMCAVTGITDVASGPLVLPTNAVCHVMTAKISALTAAL